MTEMSTGELVAEQAREESLAPELTEEEKRQEQLEEIKRRAAEINATNNAANSQGDDTPPVVDDETVEQVSDHQAQTERAEKKEEFEALVRQIESDEDVTHDEAVAKAKELIAESGTDQGDDTDPDKQWNAPAEETAPEVVEQGKSMDELILERLMENMFDVEVATKFTKCLFYGDMGTSKTVGACDTGGLPVLYVAIETGAKSLRNHPEVMKNVKKVMKVKSVNQVEKLAEQLQKGAFPEYEVIILDTFSELQKKDLDNMVDERAATTTQTLKERYAPEGKEYQGNTEHMRRIAAAFREVERHVVFITHEREDKDDMSRIFVRPDLTDKVQKTLNSYVDIVVRFTAEVDEDGNAQFFGQCRRTKGVTAKTRIGALPTIIDTPTFAKIHEADLQYSEKEVV